MLDYRVTVLVNLGMSLYMTTFWHLISNKGTILIGALVKDTLISFAVSLPFIFILLHIIMRVIND